jgi:hypothetical protein
VKNISPLKARKMGANALGTMFLSLSVDFWQIFEDFLKKSEKVFFSIKGKRMPENDEW